MKRSEIEHLLPEVFQRTLVADPEPGNDVPLGALLQTMETLHDPAEDILASLADYFNPHTTEERFLAMLSYWVNLDTISSSQPDDRSTLDWTRSKTLIAPGRLRELISLAARLSQWRGTTEGLRLFLETATGVGGFRFEETVEDADGTPLPFHARITAPAATEPQRELIENIIERESPVHITWELHFE